MQASRRSIKAIRLPRQPLFVTGRRIDTERAPIRPRPAASSHTLSLSTLSSVHISPLASSRTLNTSKLSTEYAVTQYLVGKPVSPRTNFGYMTKEATGGKDRKAKVRRLFFNRSIENFLNRFEKKQIRVSLGGVALTSATNNG